MLEIHLHGALTKFSDQPIRFAANDVRDVLSCLKSRFPGFKNFLWDHPEYVIVLTDRGSKNPRSVHPEFISTPFINVEEVHLFPAMKGAGIETALIAWGMSQAMAAIVAQVIINIAVSMVIGAITNMLSPKTENKGSERPDSKPSFIYNGPENVIEQGYQVPIVYGTHMTGSVVVSAGINVEQLAVASTQAAPPANGGGTPQPASPAPVDWQWTGSPGDSGA